MLTPELKDIALRVAKELPLEKRFSVEQICAEFAERFLAALPPAVPQGWQPIETAPKDGSWVVVTSTHNKHYRAVVQHECGFWFDSNETDHDDLMRDAATHWMPLPAAPAMAKEKS